MPGDPDGAQGHRVPGGSLTLPGPRSPTLNNMGAAPPSPQPQSGRSKARPCCAGRGSREHTWLEPAGDERRQEVDSRVCYLLTTLYPSGTAGGWGGAVPKPIINKAETGCDFPW